MEDHVSFFQGISAEECARILGRFEHRRFAAGATVIAEGDELHEIYVIQSGTAEVLLVNRSGVEQTVNRVGPGSTLGEISFFTGKPASATVRATDDLDVLVLDRAELDQVAGFLPRIYHNLGVILSQRLARATRRAVRSDLKQITVLRDHGAPALLGYALASSLAWHTRRSTLLLVLVDGAPSTELAEFIGTGVSESLPKGTESIVAGRPSDRRAYACVATPSGAFSFENLAERLEDLRDRYDYVLVQAKPEVPLASSPGRRLSLHSQRSVLSDITPDDGPPGFTLVAWSDSTRAGMRDRAEPLHVPELNSSDERALVQGILPATTPAGRVLGWVARDLAGLKVGLALGAGTAKGYAHIGVLKVLERAGLTLDYIAGTSIGAGVAMLHAMGFSPEDAANLLDKVGEVAFRITVPTRSFLSMDGVRDGLRRITGERRFEDLQLPLAVVAADITTGQEVVFRQGLLWPPVLASMSIPGIYPPQQIGDHTLVDGGVVNPVPSNVAGAMGSDVVIAVKLASRQGTVAAPAPAGSKPSRSHSILQLLIRSAEIMQSKIVTDGVARATIVIEPLFNDVCEFGLRSFVQGRSYIELGEAAASAALPRIAAALPWLNR